MLGTRQGTPPVLDPQPDAPTLGIRSPMSGIRTLMLYDLRMRNTNTTAATLANMRRRRERLAEELRDSPDEALSDRARAAIVELHHRVLATTPSHDRTHPETER